MKKKVLILTLLTLLLTGCAKEQGEIAESHPEFYYLRTDYYDEPFVIVDDVEVPEGHRVMLTNDWEKAEASPVEIDPNTLVLLTLSNEEYNDLFGETEMFEGTFSLVSVVDAENLRLYTYMIDIDEPTVTALRKAGHEGEWAYQFTKKEADEYLRKYKYIYYKL